MEKRARTPADTVQFVREAVLEGAHKRTPLSIESRRKISQNLGGAATLIEATYRDGMSYEDLRKETGVEARRLGLARRTLAKWGREIPRGRRIRAKEMEKLLSQIAEAQSFEEKQRLLEEGVDANLHNYGTTGDNRPLMPVYPLLKITGIHVRPQATQSFVNILKTAGIPVGEIHGRAQYKEGPSRYFFIVKNDIEKATQILTQHQQANGSFSQAQSR